MSLLPVFGFVYAMSYEQAFFFSLGMRASQFLSLEDVIRSSVIYVAPSIPIILFSMWMGVNIRVSSNGVLFSERDSKFEKLVFYFICANVLIIGSSYLLFGLSPELGIFFLLLIVSIFFFRFIVNAATIELGLSPHVGFVMYSLAIPAVIFAGQGIQSALQVRQANEMTYPKSGDEFFVRSLSNGEFVLSNDLETLEYHISNGRVVYFELNRKMFKGFLCEGFDWCLPIKSLSDTRAMPSDN